MKSPKIFSIILGASMVWILGSILFGTPMDSQDHKALSPRLKALYSASTVQVYDVIA